MQNSSIYEKIVKFLLLVGGIIALFYCFFNLFNIGDLNEWIANHGLTNPALNFIGMIVASIELHATVKPNDPIPYNWILMVILGVLLTIFSLLLSGGIIIVGAIMMEINVSREVDSE